MDIRLLMAISDVVNGEGFATDTAVASREAAVAGPKVQAAIRSWAATQEASTGRPIPDLRGIAKHDATLAAIGGGAKAAGGDGIEGGVKVLDEQAVKAQLTGYGITAGSIVAKVVIRYGVLVARDMKARKVAAKGV